MSEKSKTPVVPPMPMMMDQRRFPRIYLQQALPTPQTASILPLMSVMSVAGASALWTSGERFEVCDLSYTGIALLRAGGADGEEGKQESASDTTLAVGTVVKFQLQLMGQPLIGIEGRIVRATGRILALDFEPLSTDARVALEKFLQAKLIGLHLRSIDPVFFSGGASSNGNGTSENRTSDSIGISDEKRYTHWFQGPNNTNVLLWYDNLSLRRALVESGGDWLNWVAGPGGGTVVEGYASRKRAANPADSDASDSNEKGAYARPLQRDVSISLRAIDILSQASDPTKALTPLLQALLEKCHGHTNLE